YADLDDPQSLNQYTYVRNLPTTRADADGHDGWRDYWEGGTGFVRGFVSSASWGAVGAPKSTDSDMSLWGQSVGSAFEGHIGLHLMGSGVADTGVGLGAELPTEGLSTPLVVAGAGEVVFGGSMTLGAAKNGVAVLLAMANKRLGDFTPSEKKQLDQQN